MGERLPEPTPIAAPLVRSTIFAFESSEELARHFVERSERLYMRPQYPHRRTNP